METGHSAWPPPEGQCLDESAAADVIDGHRHRIRQAIFDAYADIDGASPGAPVGHRMTRPAELARCCRDHGRDGCVVATVLHEGPDPGSRRAIEVLLTWDGEVCMAAAEAPAARIA